MKSFASDNYAGVLPEIMEALNSANGDHMRSYGADPVTSRTVSLFREVFISLIKANEERNFFIFTVVAAANADARAI